jgi:hypothetical protein
MCVQGDIGEEGPGDKDLHAKKASETDIHTKKALVIKTYTLRRPRR